MTFTGRGMTFCVFEYVQIQLNKALQDEFVREFTENAPTTM